MRTGDRVALLALLLSALAPAALETSPNIVLMMADDVGWNDVGFNNSEIRTPAIDRLAVEGLRLDRYYAFSLCTPTRVAIMTGRSPLRFGMASPIIDHGGLPLDETTMGDVFQAAGYQTWYAGKWHLGHSKRAYFPNERGWSHSYGSLTGGLDHYSHNSDVLMGAPDWHRNGKALEEEGHTTDLYTAEAVRLIEGRDRERPFLLYLSWNAPHTPLQAAEEHLREYAHIEDEVRRTYAAMMTHLDESVAELIAALEREDLRERTLVIWLSDNGGYPVGGGDNSPLRGGKGSPLEGGTRVPALVNCPGMIKPGILAQLVSAHDWLPTLISASGIERQAGNPFDGYDMWPAISVGEQVERGDLILGSRFGRALFRGRWKYVETAPGWLGLGGRAPAVRPALGARRRPGGGGRPGGPPGIAGPGAAREQALYDYRADPTETNSLAAEHPDVVEELAAAAREIGRDASPLPGGFSLRDGGRFVRTGPLTGFPEDRGAHVVDRVDEDQSQPPR